MRSRSVLTALAFLFFSVSYSQNFWQPPGSSGPSSGRIVYTIAVSPVDRTVLIGTNADGMYRSTNNGISWTQISSTLNFIDIYYIAITRTGDFFAGCSGNRVYRSTDGGINWTSVYSTADSISVSLSIREISATPAGELIICPARQGALFSSNNGQSWTSIIPAPANVLSVSVSPSGIVYAVKDTVLVKSTDNGSQWTQIASGARKVLVTPTGTVYASINGFGVAVSTDEGTSWHPRSAGLGDSLVQRLAFNKNGFLFAGVGGFSGGGQYRGVYRLGSGDTSWTRLNPTQFNGLITCIATEDSGDVFVSAPGKGVFRSTDNGESWIRLTGANSISIRSLAINSTGHVFAGTDQEGIFRSTDRGLTWEQINQGLTDLNVPCLAFNSGDHAFAGTHQKGIFRSTNNGEAWTRLSTMGVDSQILALAANTRNWLFAGTRYSAVLRSTDNGASWESRDSNLTNTCVTSLAVLPTDVVFAGTSPQYVFRSTNDGLYWENFSNGLPYALVQSLALNPQQHLYAATTPTGLFRTSDLGAQWQHLPAGILDSAMSQLAINSDGHIYVVVYGSGMLRSTDDGLSWHTLNSGLTSLSVECIAFDRDGYAYAGTDGGVFRSVSPTVGVDEGESVPSGYRLEQNYPNPFNPSTIIKFQIPRQTDGGQASTTHVTLKVFDLLGREVATLVDEEMNPGGYERMFDAAGLGSGVYFYRLQAGGRTVTKKLLLLR